MNVWYRRINSRQWELAICVGYYGNYFCILRWDATLEDFDEVMVPPSRIRASEQASRLFNEHGTLVLP